MFSLHNLLSHLFRREDITSGEGYTYLYRWILWKGSEERACYLHRFVADDGSRYMHDHPKRFWSIGLWGTYTEQTPSGVEVFRAPWVRSFPPEHTHRITDARNCWTLVFVGRWMQNWGFYTSTGWVHWREYVASLPRREK